MDEIIIYPSAILGLVLLGIYWIRCGNAKVDFDHSIIVSTIFNAGGLVAGSLLVVGFFFEDVRNLMQEINIYILISGLVVFATSARGVQKDIITPTKKKQSDTNSPD